LVHHNAHVPVPEDEKRLFSLVASGDEKAFEALFNLFLSRLHPFIIKFVKSELAAQEIIQETFIRVWLNRDKLGEIENPGGWLFKVASNECYTYLRKTVLNNKFSNPITTEPDPANGTHEWLDVKELNRLIGEAVNQLPAQRKKIYQMSRDEGKTIPEIALALQLSPNTVKNALVTSLKFIREYLAKSGVIISSLLLLFGKK
jgi:RNA polymerase sigma-70 factor (ECF subfamily)